MSERAQEHGIPPPVTKTSGERIISQGDDYLLRIARADDDDRYPPSRPARDRDPVACKAESGISKRAGGRWRGRVTGGSTSVSF